MVVRGTVDDWGTGNELDADGFPCGWYDAKSGDFFMGFGGQFVESFPASVALTGRNGRLPMNARKSFSKTRTNFRPVLRAGSLPSATQCPTVRRQTPSHSPAWRRVNKRGPAPAPVSGRSLVCVAICSAASNLLGSPNSGRSVRNTAAAAIKVAG